MKARAKEVFNKQAIIYHSRGRIQNRSDCRMVNSCLNSQAGGTSKLDIDVLEVSSILEKNSKNSETLQHN